MNLILIEGQSTTNLKIDNYSSEVDRSVPMTGQDLIDYMGSIKLTTSNAVKLIALANALSKVLPDAKEYLSELKSISTGSFVDSTTGLAIAVTDTRRSNITNKRIKSLEASIKQEKQLIKDGVKEGDINYTEYKKWSLIK